MAPEVSRDVCRSAFSCFVAVIFIIKIIVIPIYEKITKNFIAKILLQLSSILLSVQQSLRKNLVPNSRSRDSFEPRRNVREYRRHQFLHLLRFDITSVEEALSKNKLYRFTLWKLTSKLLKSKNEKLKSRLSPYFCYSS